MVKFLDKITVVVARNERQGQVEAVIVNVPNLSSTGDRPPSSELAAVERAWLISGRTVSDAQR